MVVDAGGVDDVLRAHVPLRCPVGTKTGMWLLLLLILAILLFGVWGAIKLTFWVLLIALAVAVIAGFLGRSMFTNRGGY
jgi:hypothetical protein